MSLFIDTKSSMLRVGVLALLSGAGMLGGSSAGAVERFSLELEGGPVWQSRNDVQIPNDDTGTRFSLVDLAGEGPVGAARLYLTWNINERHGLRVLLAPFSIEERGVPGEAIDFAGARFAADTPVDATYKFNSWRLTYAYRFHAGEDWRWWVGFTAKLRDAKVRLEQGDTASEDTDLGFVPLLHVRGDWRFAEGWHALLDADALAGGPGRAIDASVKVAREFGDRGRIAVGYRTLEGGADVESVYNFAWLHYVVGSVQVGF